MSTEKGCCPDNGCGKSGIEVFFTRLNGPFGNASEDSAILNYKVNVYNPDITHNHGIQVIGVPAPHGYACIDLPPGRYIVTGTTHGSYVNFDSNETVVNVGCGQRVCVTIIPRSLHFCIWWLWEALQIIQANPKLAPEIAPKAQAVTKLLEELERAVPKEHHMPEFFKTGTVALRKELKMPSHREQE